VHRANRYAGSGRDGPDAKTRLHYR
jgi:hypothetical protein